MASFLSDFISCYDKQIRLTYWVYLNKSVISISLKKQNQVLWGVFFCHTGLFPQRCRQQLGFGWGARAGWSSWKGRMAGVYSRDWSMRSCLRTLVWLVSLISPARNISSTTVYTFNCRCRKRIHGRKWGLRVEWKKKKRSKVESTVPLFSLVCRRLKGLNFLENCLSTMRSHLPACGYSTPPLGHYNLKITSSWLNIQANVTTHSSVWQPRVNAVLATQQSFVFALN